MNGLDWGTVPAWASAIGTSGSLLLGFTILLRDRRREERREAQRVVTYAFREGSEVRVHLLNTADRPVSYPEVVVTGPEGVFTFGETRLKTGEEALVDIPRYVDGVRNRPLAVRFVDADGYAWVRDLQSGNVYRRHALRRGDANVRLLLRPKLWGTFLLYRSRKRHLRG